MRRVAAVPRVVPKSKSAAGLDVGGAESNLGHVQHTFEQHDNMYANDKRIAAARGVVYAARHRNRTARLVS